MRDIVFLAPSMYSLVKNHLRLQLILMYQNYDYGCHSMTPVFIIYTQLVLQRRTERRKRLENEIKVQKV